jgi:replicative DNA helicase
MKPSAIPELSLGKLPPQAIEIEVAVLGGALLESHARRKVLEVLSPEDFYREEHKIIYTGIVELERQGKSVDMLTVVQYLRTTNELEICGGAYYIATLTSNVVSTHNIAEHAVIVKEYSLKRKIIALASELSKDGYQDDVSAEDLIFKMKKAAASLTDTIYGNLGAATDMKTAMTALVKHMQSKKNNSNSITGIASGMMAVDKITSGWQDQDLIILAARPGMGKTTFALSVIRNAAVMFGVPVGMFSLEMSTLQLTAKLSAIDSEIELRKIRHASMEDYEWQQFMMRTSKLTSAPIYIDDSAGLNLYDFESRATAMVEKHGVKLIAVDYIQLMRGEQSKGSNRENEISSISRALKRVAKNLNIPIIALSQLSRAVESRGGMKKPGLADLRESGAIEQDADIVMFLWRPEYYKFDQDDQGQLYTPGFTEVIIAKHRNGSTDTVAVQFLPKFSVFKDIQAFPTPDKMPEATISHEDPKDDRDLPF